MSTIVRAETQISAVIPELFKQVADSVGKQKKHNVQLNENGVTVRLDSSYNRVNFKWNKDGSNFQANYDSMHKKEADGLIKEIQNGYITSLAAQIAKQKGFRTEQMQQTANGQWFLKMGR